MKKHIPNFLTLSNLLGGSIAIILTLEGYVHLAPWFLLASALFDFLDGMVARALGVSGELGLQLDSLADMVSFGLAPSIIVYHYWVQHISHPVFKFFPLILAAGACYRLAKFNIDKEQSEFFKGIPTPAMTLFFITQPILEIHNNGLFNTLNNAYVLAACIIGFTILMNVNTPLLSFKIKTFDFSQENIFRLLLVLGTIILFVFFQWLAISLGILLYVALSLIWNITRNKQNL